MYAQRVLNSDPFTHRRRLHRARAANSAPPPLPPPLTENAGGRRQRGRGAHTHTQTGAHANARVAYTKLTRARARGPYARTGWGTRWQQCVTDRPANESRSPHRPIQLYIQGVFSTSAPIGMRISPAPIQLGPTTTSVLGYQVEYTDRGQ